MKISKVRLKLLSVAFLSIVVATIVTAQRAEPLRLEFKPGSNNLVVRGTLSGRQKMEYGIDLKRDQRITLTTAGQGALSVDVRVKTPQNTDLQLSAQPRQWTGTASETGEYVILVGRLHNTPGVTSYRLKVLVQ